MRFFWIICIFVLNIYASALNFKTLECNFTQIITNDENSTITYTGSFYATNRNRALWIYKTPVEKKVYFKNKKVAIFEPELEQVIITTLKNSPNITQIIKKAKQISKNQYSTIFDDTQYFIKTKDGKILSINYKDKLENRVNIILSNVETSTILDDALFEISIPKDFDIVTQ